MKLSYITVPAIAVLCTVASAAPYSYAVWSSSTSSAATGTVGGVGVQFSGPNLGLLTNGTNNYFTYDSSDYTSSVVDNAPVASDDFIQLEGGNNATYSLTFSQPVNNLVVSVLSLGQGGDAIPFNFTVPISSLLSQGTDQWGGNSSDLYLANSDYSLVGTEGSGSILFSGSTTTLTWTLPSAEYWYGMTVAIPATPEPSSFLGLGLGVGAFGLMVRRKRSR